MKNPLSRSALIRTVLTSALVTFCFSLKAEELVLTDTLEDFSQVLTVSPNMSIVSKEIDWLPEVDSRATRKGLREAYLIYLVTEGFSGFQIEVYTFGGVEKSLNTDRLEILISEDGKEFEPVNYKSSEPRQTAAGYSWSSVTLSLADEISGDAPFLKILLPPVDKEGWWPIITKVEFFKTPDPARRNIFSKRKR